MFLHFYLLSSVKYPEFQLYSVEYVLYLRECNVWFVEISKNKKHKCHIPHTNTISQIPDLIHLSQEKLFLSINSFLLYHMDDLLDRYGSVFVRWCAIFHDSLAKASIGSWEGTGLSVWERKASTEKGSTSCYCILTHRGIFARGRWILDNWDKEKDKWYQSIRENANPPASFAA